MWEMWEILQVFYANYSKTLMSTAPALLLSVVLSAICIWLWNALFVKKIDKKKRKMCFEFNDSELIWYELNKNVGLFFVNMQFLFVYRKRKHWIEPG